MKTRTLGSTSLRVTPIGLGLAALGRPAYITRDRDADLGDDRSVETMERRCHVMLDAAYDAGIRYIDAARSYGLAERFLANWLDRRNPADITIGSKWGYTYVGDWRTDAAVHEVKDLSIGALRRQLAESRALLGKRIDLYQIHSATIESGVLDDGAVIRELAQLRAEGVAVGLSVTGPRQAETIRQAMSVAVDGVDLFQSVQATWNVLEPSAAPALAEAHDRGWGVIVKEALANGRLAARAEVALAAALAQPWADVVLSGAVTPEQLQRGVSAIERSADTSPDLKALAEGPEVYWRKRQSLSWE